MKLVGVGNENQAVPLGPEFTDHGRHLAIFGKDIIPNQFEAMIR